MKILRIGFVKSNLPKRHPVSREDEKDSHDSKLFIRLYHQLMNYRRDTHCVRFGKKDSNNNISKILKRYNHVLEQEVVRVCREKEDDLTLDHLEFDLIETVFKGDHHHDEEVDTHTLTKTKFLIPFLYAHANPDAFNTPVKAGRQLQVFSMVAYIYLPFALVSYTIFVL